MVAEEGKVLLDWNALEIGETFPVYEYMIQQDNIDQFRKGVMDLSLIHI